MTNSSPTGSNRIVLLPITLAELEERIKQIIEASLNKLVDLFDGNAGRDDLLTIEEVCAIFKVSKVTIHNWKRTAKLPFFRMPGSKRVYFKRDEVMAVLKRIGTRKNS